MEQDQMEKDLLQVEAEETAQVKFMQEVFQGEMEAVEEREPIEAEVDVSQQEEREEDAEDKCGFTSEVKSGIISLGVYQQ